MKASIIKTLNHLNARFYEAQAQSFGATRTSPWTGWELLLDALDSELCAATQESGGLSYLDVAAGNMRFFAFLDQALPKHECGSALNSGALRLSALDNCMPLANQRIYTGSVDFHEHDVLAGLLDGPALKDVLEPGFSLVTSFGFLHHIPSFDLRLSFLEQLIELAKPGALVVVSLWQFMSDTRFATKAAATTAQALEALREAGTLNEDDTLEPGDALLGWQEKPLELGSIRYAHSFSDEEIAELVSALSLKAELLASFTADGKHNNMNTYLAFKKKAR